MNWFGETAGDYDGRESDLSDFGVRGIVGVHNEFMSVGPGGQSSIQTQARTARATGQGAEAVNAGFAQMEQNAIDTEMCILVDAQGNPVHLVPCPPGFLPGQRVTAAQGEAAIAQGAQQVINAPSGGAGPSGTASAPSGPLAGDGSPGLATAGMTPTAKMFLVGSAIAVAAYALTKAGIRL